MGCKPGNPTEEEISDATGTGMEKRIVSLGTSLHIHVSFVTREGSGETCKQGAEKRVVSSEVEKVQRQHVIRIKH